MNVYVAASWRTPQQPAVVARLRAAGHAVYDFRENGFGWSQVGLPEPPTFEAYMNALVAPRAVQGFERDMAALRTCEACVLVLPAGRSAHLEFGWAIASGRFTVVVFLEEPVVPDLMYLAASCFVRTPDELVEQLRLWTWKGSRGV